MILKNTVQNNINWSRRIQRRSKLFGIPCNFDTNEISPPREHDVLPSFSHPFRSRKPHFSSCIALQQRLIYFFDFRPFALLLLCLLKKPRHRLPRVYPLFRPLHAGLARYLGRDAMVDTVRRNFCSS